MSGKLYIGDCLEVLPTLEANSIDTIITDPPYGLSFMGKDWDRGVPGVHFWEEALRVAKPGAYLLAFGGTRTHHRLMVAIEDAGWEIRDCMMWLYGSGFPKAHDISKAIDKMDSVEEQKERRYRFTEWVRSQGVTAAQIDEATGTCMGSHYTTNLSQPAIMTTEHLEQCRHLFTDVPEWVESEARIRSVESKNFAEREVVGVHERTPGGFGDHRFSFNSQDITAPATPEAQLWDGYKTALKPAWEPIIVAMKPLDGTFANNALTHGVAGLNIDGGRIGTEGARNNGSKADKEGYSSNKILGKFKALEKTDYNKGRYPSNVLLDEAAAAMLDEQSGELTSGTILPHHKLSESENRAMSRKNYARTGVTSIGDSGGASRFFYTGKASANERGDYNNHPTVKPADLMQYLVKLTKTPTGGVVLDMFAGSGTTGLACQNEGRDYILIELDPHHGQIIERRLRDNYGMFTDLTIIQ